MQGDVLERGADPRRSRFQKDVKVLAKDIVGGQICPSAPVSIKRFPAVNNFRIADCATVVESHRIGGITKPKVLKGATQEVQRRRGIIRAGRTASAP